VGEVSREHAPPTQPDPARWVRGLLDERMKKRWMKREKREKKRREEEGEEVEEWSSSRSQEDHPSIS